MRGIFPIRDGTLWICLNLIFLMSNNSFTKAVVHSRPCCFLIYSWLKKHLLTTAFNLDYILNTVHLWVHFLIWKQSQGVRWFNLLLACLQLDGGKYLTKKNKPLNITSADITTSLDGSRVFVWSVCGQQALSACV